jgi:hypothetical protein
LLLAGVKADVQREARAALSFHAGLGRGAGRAAGPVGTGFETRLSVGGLPAVIDLIRRLTAQDGVGTVAVEPGRELLRRQKGVRPNY